MAKNVWGTMLAVALTLSCFQPCVCGQDPAAVKAKGVKSKVESDLSISLSELKRNGAFGFPAAEARTHLDSDDVRIQSWNDDQRLVVQAVVWSDGDETLGETSDGRKIGDGASLVFDFNRDGKKTPEVDRDYSLNPWPAIPGLYYTVPYRQGSSHLQRDSKGRGAIRYFQVDDDHRVRVDTFVIPLAELAVEVGDEIGFAVLITSTVPELRLDSIGYESDGGIYYARDLPPKDFHVVELTLGKGSFDATQVPAGRKDRKKRKQKRKPVPAVGALPPDIAVAEWMNLDKPPTPASSRGKVVLLDFWATWCGPCVAGIPDMNELHDELFDEGLRIFSVTDQSRDGIENFQQHTEMKYGVGVGSKLSKDFGVTGLPHAFLIGRDGKLIWEGHPTDDKDKVRKLIRDALAVPDLGIPTQPDIAIQMVPGSQFTRTALGQYLVNYHTYVPTSYKSDSLSPMMIAFSPSGNGAGILEKLKESAEAAGWIIVGCDKLRNGMRDIELERKIEAEVVDDILKTVPHDPRRLYLAGFSGGGMRAYGLSASRPENVAGVIAYGGWLGGPDYQDVAYPTGLHVAVVNGDKDHGANHWKATDTKTLTNCGCRVKAFSFEGGHGVAPPEVTSEVIVWLNAVAEGEINVAK